MTLLMLAALLQESLLTDGDAVKPADQRFESTSLKRGDARRIRDAEAWKTFWKEHSQAKDAKAPEVDFAKRMVLVTVVDTAVGCLAPELASLDLRETKDALRLIAVVTPGGCNNRMHGHPLALGRHAVMVVVPRSAKRVDVVAKPKDGDPKVVTSLEAVKE